MQRLRYPVLSIHQLPQLLAPHGQPRLREVTTRALARLENGQL